MHYCSKRSYFCPQGKEIYHLPHFRENIIEMDYAQTLQYLFSQLPMYQRIGQAAYKADLNNTLALDDYFGHPHHTFRTIHVAGTNGKGSVSHSLAAILQSAGYKTGLYTSPHLKDFRERIRVDGKMIAEEAVVDFIAHHQPILEQLKPSFFEMTVAMAFDYFRSEKVDVAVVEVGMGGRLDSTNIIMPDLSVITNIGLDHTAFLGNTLAAIAGEKGGIIKSGVPVVIGERDPQTAPVFAARAQEQGSELVFAEDRFEVTWAANTIARQQVFNICSQGALRYKDLEFSLLGHYQRKNIITILAAVELLQKCGYDLPEAVLRQGLGNVTKLTGLMGRWQEIGHNPLMVVDTGHNEHGVREVVAQIQATPHQKLHIVWGMVNDKDPKSVLGLLPKDATYYFTRASIPRSLDEQLLAAHAQEAGLNGQCYGNVADAVMAAKKNAGVNDLIFIGGSTFIVADAL